MSKISPPLYFIALLPPTPLLEEIDVLKHHFKEAYGSKAALNSPPHLTLHMPFQWKEEKETKLIDALSSFSKGQHRFKIHLENFGCFEPRVIFITVRANPGLDLLQKNLHQFSKQKLNLFNARYKDLPFHPHVTLAFRDLKKQKFFSAWEEFKVKKFSHEFVPDKITLLKHDGQRWQTHCECPMR